MTSSSSRTDGGPPGTEGAWASVGIGVTCLLVGLLLVAAGASGSAAAIVVGAILGCAGLFIANAGRQRVRARRVGRAANRCHWASVCYRSENQFMLRAFIIDADGVHLTALGGRRLADWPWSTITKAVAMPVTVAGRERPGLTLDLTDAAPPVSFAFPPATGFGVSPAAAERASHAVRAQLGTR